MADIQQIIDEVKNLETKGTELFEYVSGRFQEWDNAVNEARQQIDNFIQGARGAFPAVNLLKNSYMLDINGDGVLDSPLSGYVFGNASIKEKKVYSCLDPSLPDIVKKALIDLGITYMDRNGNLSICCHVPFNVQKFVFTGNDYSNSHAFFIPINPVKGRFTFGTLAVISTTGNIEVEGLGLLEPNRVYKHNVHRSGEYRNWHIDVPWMNIKGEVDIWVIGPWVVAGKFLETGENKGHPLFLYGNYIITF